MYKEQRAEDVLLYWQSMVIRNQLYYLPGPIFHVQLSHKVVEQAVAYEEILDSKLQLRVLCRYNGGVSSCSRLQIKPNDLSFDRLHEVCLASIYV